MGHTSEGVEASPDMEASESKEFACPYCGESYESAYEQGMCQASHFENTESISQPRSDRSRNSKNLLEEWKD